MEPAYHVPTETSAQVGGGGGGGGGGHKSGEGAVGDTLPSGVRRSPSSYVFSY